MQSDYSKIKAHFPMQPAFKYKCCPAHVAIRVLGKKWTLLILRDIAILDIRRFGEIKRSLPGLTPRVLSMRLRELEENGFIEAEVIKENPRVVEWHLTGKGQDTISILLAFMEFGAKWYPAEVFEDGQSHTLEELYPEKNGA
ncbi:transcriptional regulator, HxlR family [Methanolacinia petrolearia DSM 11571]|uniref:Transcriptional regulator, HxlR family n=2 Tax=Methanolacinia TaxID=230355 RepID=E1RKL0_METP4|nr:transcriptional regulator, HxlR family [Methanolacinia petrolearia DSM 11571]